MTLVLDILDLFTPREIKKIYDIRQYNSYQVSRSETIVTTRSDSRYVYNSENGRVVTIQFETAEESEQWNVCDGWKLKFGSNLQLWFLLDIGNIPGASSVECTAYISTFVWVLLFFLSWCFTLCLGFGCIQSVNKSIDSLINYLIVF